jgi:linoleoyl-CoA desaturase
MSNIKFNGNQSAFYVDLKTRVNQYFSERKMKMHGNFRLYFKAGLMMAMFFGIYTTLVFFTPAALWSVLLCILLAVVTAGIGFNVMHDGGHGSFSKSKSWNKAAALTLNMLGASSHLWNIKHNQIHHTFTNVQGHDDDIENEPFLRMHSGQKRYWMHRFQHVYWVFIYGLMYFTWVFWLDIRKYAQRRITYKNDISFGVKEHFGFWITKALYTFFFLVLPMMMVGVIPVIVGYCIFSFTTGVIISVVFQLAHAVEETTFMAVKEEQTVLENDWAIHQVLTTANFATRSKIISFFTGGLNFQIEHHLFPRISHVYYPQLALIVKTTCAEYGIAYYEQPTIWSAIASHVKFLKRMGR